MARGSLNEVKHWLRRAHKRSLLTSSQTDLRQALIEELAPTLNALPQLDWSEELRMKTCAQLTTDH